MADSLQIDAQLKRAAEREMARRLVDESSDAEDDLNASKRQKTDNHEDQIVEIGRFQYASPGDLSCGVCGFLISTVMKREISATKEATELLRGPWKNSGTTGEGDIISTEMPRQLLSELNLAPVKISARGLSFLRAVPQGSDDIDNLSTRVQQAALQVYHDVDGQTSPAPRFVQRILPITTTCSLDVPALKGAAAGLANAASSFAEEGKKLKFGVSLHSREFHERPAVDGGKAVPLLPSRGDIIAAVAKGLTNALEDRGPRTGTYCGFKRSRFCMLCAGYTIGTWGGGWCTGCGAALGSCHQTKALH